MGYPVSLQNAAIGLNLPGKLAGVEGVDVPILWANGQAEVVIKYVAQDVRTTLAVALNPRSNGPWHGERSWAEQVPCHFTGVGCPLGKP